MVTQKLGSKWGEVLEAEDRVEVLEAKGHVIIRQAKDGMEVLEAKEHVIVRLAKTGIFVVVVVVVVPLGDQ